MEKEKENKYAFQLDRCILIFSSTEINISYMYMYRY